MHRYIRPGFGTPIKHPIARASLALLASLTPALAGVEVTSNEICAQVTAIGGGAATPIKIGPVKKADSNPAGAFVDFTTVAAGDALNGIPEVVGYGSGTSGVTCTTEVTSTAITGSGNVTSDFEASGLGTGLADSRVTLDIRFEVTGVSMDYILDGSFTGGVGGIDQIIIRRFNPGLPPSPVEIVNGTNQPVVGKTGTLIPASYQLSATITANTAGGPAQSPGTDATGFAFSLDFAPSNPTVVSPGPFEELRIREFGFDDEGNPFIRFDAQDGGEYKVTTSTSLDGPWVDIPEATITGRGGISTIGFPVDFPVGSGTIDPIRFYRVELVITVIPF